MDLRIRGFRVKSPRKGKIQQRKDRKIRATGELSEVGWLTRQGKIQASFFLYIVRGK